MFACNAALLLVDASQGVQAQTLANYYLALEQNLHIVPVITKVDQVTAMPDQVSNEMSATFGVPPSDILQVW